ncbi:hypothetical protein GBAR_LOCUS8401 [Geodia barretti]|nr:hypothetical protein GBAR_LOCUS8401 [Geodia barretti]
MQDCGLYDEMNCIHRDCLRFCFMHLIQQELDKVAHELNTHTTRSSKHCLVPAGVPNELYFLPEVQEIMQRNRTLLHPLSFCRQ